MFIEGRRLITAPLALVLDRITRQFDTSGLDDVLSAEFADTHYTLLRAGVAGITKKIELTALAPRSFADRVLIPIRWQAVGRTGDLFPTLDANLTLSPAQNAHTELRVTGSYLPPFGRTGAILDQMLLHQVATATLDRFLDQLTATATQPARTHRLHPEPARLPGWQPRTDPGPASG